jgi:hypothetical protein
MPFAVPVAVLVAFIGLHYGPFPGVSFIAWQKSALLLNNFEQRMSEKENRNSGIHPGYVYIFDVETDLETDTCEPQSLVKVGASGENAPSDAVEKEYWLHVLATLARYKKLLAPLNTALDLPHGTSHSIAVVRRAYETWLGRFGKRTQRDSGSD